MTQSFATDVIKSHLQKGTVDPGYVNMTVLDVLRETDVHQGVERCILGTCGECECECAA